SGRTEIRSEAQDLPLLNRSTGFLFVPLDRPLPGTAVVAYGLRKLVLQEACASCLACRDVATEWQQESRNRPGQTISRAFLGPPGKSSHKGCRAAESPDPGD